VFNDDNIHNVLTSFDMLILKTYYAADLRNGMSRTEVAARLPALLNRLNPAGRNSPMRGADLTNRNSITSVQTALSSDVSPTRRRAAAQQAVTLSDAMGWSGPRTAFALYAQRGHSLRPQPPKRSALGHADDVQGRSPCLARR